MLSQAIRAEKTTIEDILEGYIPANQRSWYPWAWPDREWFTKTARDNPRELNGFIAKVRKLSLEDLFFFSDEIMREPNYLRLHIGLHDELCHVIQSEEDVVILMPRGFLKTTLFSVYYPIWSLLKNPNLKFLQMSDTQTVSKKFLSETKQHSIRNKRLNLIFPEFKPDMSTGDSARKYSKWSETEITIARSIISKEPSIIAVGARTEVTGTHFDRQLYDDIMTEENATTQEKIDGIINRFDMSLN